MNTPEPIDYNAEIEQLLLDRIYLIDQINHFGLGNSEDERPAFVLLGTPAELIAAISALLVSARKDGKQSIVNLGAERLQDDDMYTLSAFIEDAQEYLDRTKPEGE